MYQVKVLPKAEKQLDKIPLEYRQRIIDTIMDLRFDPFCGKKLLGKRKDQYSIRCWPYRILYEIYKNQILVLVTEVGHRQGVYNK